MTCYFCGSRFFAGGYMSEPEDCDCGACMPAHYAQDLEPEDFERYRAAAAAVTDTQTLPGEREHGVSAIVEA